MLEIVRKAYSTKVEHAKGLEKCLAEMENKYSNSQASLEEASQSISERSNSGNTEVMMEMSWLFTEMQAAVLCHENAMVAKDASLQ